MKKNKYRLLAHIVLEEPDLYGEPSGELLNEEILMEADTLTEIMESPVVGGLYENPPKNGYVNPVTMIITMAERFGKAIIAREKINSMTHTIYVKLTPPETQNRPVYRDSDGDWIEDYINADEYGNAQIDWVNPGNLDEDEYGNPMWLQP